MIECDCDYLDIDDDLLQIVEEWLDFDCHWLSLIPF